MFATFFPWPLHRLRAFAGVALVGAVMLAITAGQTHAAGVTVLVADDGAAHAEFVRQMRSDHDMTHRFDVVRLMPGTALEPAEEDRVVVGVRTRGVRNTADTGLILAVGPIAAKAAMDRPGQEPLLLALLSRMDYESLKTHPVLRRTDRRIGVLLRDPAMTDQLALIDAVLPRKRRIGIVTTADSEPLVRELQRAAQGWDLQIEYAPDARSLAAALRAVTARSDALMVLPDLIGDSQAATLAVLRAGAGTGLPVFGASEGLVRSGGLAAAVSTPTQLAQQAKVLGQKMTASGQGGVWVEAATPSTVRVNTTVARSLGLRLPDERELTERVTATR